MVTAGACTHTHTHTQGLQSTEADTESVYDQLEKNKPAEELQEQGVSMNLSRHLMSNKSSMIPFSRLRTLTTLFMKLHHLVVFMQ